MRTTYTLDESEHVLALWRELHDAALAHRTGQYRSPHTITLGDVYVLLADLDRRLNLKERGIP